MSFEGIRGIWYFIGVIIFQISLIVRFFLWFLNQIYVASLIV